MPPHRLSRWSPAIATLLVAMLCLAACGGGPDSSSTPSPSSSSSASPTSPTSSGSSAPTTSTYVALGDSYTAAPLVPTTEQDDGCLRSDSNYPALAAAKLPGTRLVDVSCSGASTLSLVGVQTTGGHQQPPQFSALTAQTSLVTIGIGGNDDALFGTIVGGCVQAAAEDPGGSPCQAYMRAHAQKPGGDLLFEKVADIRSRVGAAVVGIHDRAPNAKVLVVGYPQLVPASGQCEELPLASGDYPYVARVLVALDRSLEASARAGDATYVDVRSASRGHDICAGADAWINGSTTDPNRALAFHPFAAEQQAVADLVLAAAGRS